MNLSLGLGALKKLVNVLLWYTVTSSTKDDPALPLVYLDFQDSSVFLRYHVTLAYAFSLLPANVRWKFRPTYIVRNVETRHKSWWQQGFFRFDFLGNQFGGKGPTVVITDSPENYRSNKSLRVIQVCKAGSSDLPDPGGKFDWPFLAHPNFIFGVDQHKKANNGKPDSRGTRRFRVCFAGNCDARHYLSSAELSDLRVLSRARAKAFIESTFKSKVLSVEQWADKEKLTAARSETIALVNSFKAGLDFSAYKELLSASHFFLALPGISSTVTHSLAESLSCGCIPILPRSMMLYPYWVDGENCLLYCDEETLAHSVNRALAANEDTLYSLKAGAEHIYLERYSVHTAAMRLIDSGKNRLSLRNV